MTHRLVTLAVEVVLVDAILGFFYYGRLASFAVQEVIGWALEVLTIDQLLDKIFDAYMEGDSLMVPYGGKLAVIAWGNENDLCATFPDTEERQLFAWGLALRVAGRSRSEVKRALRAAHAELKLA